MSATAAASPRRAGRTPASAMAARPLVARQRSPSITAHPSERRGSARRGPSPRPVGAGLGAVAADAHGAPGAGPVLGGVQERPAAGAFLADLEPPPCPGGGGRGDRGGEAG